MKNEAEHPETEEVGTDERKQSATTRGEGETRAAAGSESPQPAEAPPSPEELAELRRKADDYDRLLERLKRVTADYLNSQKRLEREMEERCNYAIESFARELLPVADDLARAISAAREHKSVEKILEGIEIVEKHLYAVLERHGITPVRTQEGDVFDPDMHEAVSVVETDRHGPNRIVHELQRGFRIHRRLLRPARVVVSTEPKREKEAEETGTENKEE